MNAWLVTVVHDCWADKHFDVLAAGMNDGTSANGADPKHHLKAK